MVLRLLLRGLLVATALLLLLLAARLARAWQAARADGRKELQRIRQQLTRLALANCAVSFSLYDSQRSCTVLQTRSVPDACVCFAHLFGKTQAGKLARLEPEPAVEGAAAALRLEGLLSRPGCGYHTRELQFLCARRPARPGAR